MVVTNGPQPRSDRSCTKKKALSLDDDSHIKNSLHAPFPSLFSHTHESSSPLENCVATLSSANSICELPTGVDRLKKTLDFDRRAGTIKAAPNADVVIDGTVELTPRKHA